MFNVQQESSFSLPSLDYNLQQIRNSLEQIKLVSHLPISKHEEFSFSAKGFTFPQSTSCLGIVSDDLKRYVTDTPEIRTVDPDTKQVRSLKPKILGLASIDNRKRTQSMSHL